MIRAPETTARLDALDGWRAISVLLVILYHLQETSSIAVRLPFPLGNYGRLGVEFFFGISGFVICRGLLRELNTSGTVSLAAFYVRRSFRILPPLALYVGTIYLLARTGWVYEEALSVTRVFIFTCNIAGADCGGYLGDHTWSLSVEEQFYVVFPLLFIAAGAWRRHVLTAVAFALPVIVIVLYALKLHDAAAFASNFLTIAAGFACALHEDRVRRIVRHAPTWTIPAAVIAIVGLLTLPPRPVTTALLCMLEGPLILFVLMASTFNVSRIREHLTRPALVGLGRASYSVYLWQQLATYAFPNAGIAFYAASISACVPFALASYRWLEMPMIAVGARLSKLTKSAYAPGRA